MARRVVWSRRDLADVEGIATYIAKDSTSYVSTVVRKVLNSTRRLSIFPLSGRIVPKVDDENIREVFVYSYRIIYRVEDDIVLVLAVIHGKREL